jgi:hypothetical protein
MHSFNVLSLFVFFGIFSILGGSMAILYYRRLDRSARYWAIATLLSGVTVLATVFRGSLPPLLGYSIPIGLNMACYVLMGHGLTILGDPQERRKDPWDHLLLGSVVFIALLETTRHFAGAPAALVVTSLGFGAASLWSSAQAQLHYQRTGNMFACWLRWTMYALGVVQLMRIQGIFTGLATSAFVQDALNLAIYSVIFVLGLLRYFFYVAMRIQEKADAATEAARQVETTAHELASRNAFIASAMHEAPVACLVTDTQNNVLVGNKEAERLLRRPLPLLGQVPPEPVKLAELFIGMGDSTDTLPGHKRIFFVRSGHAGDARCVSVQAEMLPDTNDLPQQVFILREEPTNIQQAADTIRAEALKAGHTLLLTRDNGEVLTASSGWVELQRDSGCDTGSGLWETLTSLHSAAGLPSVLGKVAASRENSAKALEQARKRATVQGCGGSAFIRLAGGRICDVLIDPITLSDQADKLLLVELRIRTVAGTRPTVTVEEDASEGLIQGLGLKRTKA